MGVLDMGSDHCFYQVMVGGGLLILSNACQTMQPNPASNSSLLNIQFPYYNQVISIPRRGYRILIQKGASSPKFAHPSIACLKTRAYETLNRTLWKPIALFPQQLNRPQREDPNLLSFRR